MESKAGFFFVAQFFMQVPKLQSSTNQLQNFKLQLLQEIPNQKISPVKKLHTWTKKKYYFQGPRATYSRNKQNTTLLWTLGVFYAFCSN